MPSNTHCSKEGIGGSRRAGHVESVISAANGGAIDINSKIGSDRQCERIYCENRRSVSAISRGKVCSGGGNQGAANHDFSQESHNLMRAKEDAG